MENLIRHPAFQIVVNSVVREIRLVFFLSFFALCAGTALLMVSLKYGILFAFLGSILVGISAWLYFQYREIQDPEKSPIIKALREEQGQIVWIYPYITEVMPFGVSLFKRCYIIIKLDDGAEHSFIIRMKEKKLLLKWMKRLLPHTTFGFSKDREARYGISPESFLDRNFRK